MKYLSKLRYNYHDARLCAIHLETGRVIFIVELNPLSNQGARGSTSLAFENVKNMIEIRERFACRESCALTELNDEIVGVAQLSSTRYLVDLRDYGGVEIECRGISEI